MPSRTSTVRPVIVEVKPSNLKVKSHYDPPSPGSPKAVRFAEAATDRQVPRRLSDVEVWSCRHFETHARSCPECFDPLDVYLRRDRLCVYGHALAQDVAEHFYYQDGQVYSTPTDSHKNVRVELEEGHDQVRQLLRSQARARRSSHRTVPIISYAPPTATPAAYRPRIVPEEVYVEPATSRRKSKYRPSRYNTVVDQDDADHDRQPFPSPTTTTTSHEGRGSLYVKDIQRQRREAYKVEIREPADEQRQHASSRRRRQHDSRQSEVYFD